MKFGKRAFGPCHLNWVKNHIRNEHLLLPLPFIESHENLHKNVNKHNFHSHDFIQIFM